MKQSHHEPLVFARLMLAGATVLGAGAGLALPLAAQAQAVTSVQIGPPPRAEVLLPPCPGLRLGAGA